MLLPLLVLSLAQAGDATVLPESTAEIPPVLRCHVEVGPDAITVDGVHLLALTTAEGEGGEAVTAIPEAARKHHMIVPLYDRLFAVREREKVEQPAWSSLAILTQLPELEHDGELLLSIDADTPFSVVRDVLYTAGQAQFGSFLFLTDNPWEDALRTIEVGLPFIGSPRTVDFDIDRPPLNLSIMVDDEGLFIAGADSVIDPEGESWVEGERRPTIPCAEGGCATVDDYDWPELARLLGLIKDEYPYELELIVVPASDVPYEVIVRLMDTARWAPHLPIDAERDAWEAWKGERTLAFPWPVIAGGAP